MIFILIRAVHIFLNLFKRFSRLFSIHMPLPKQPQPDFIALPQTNLRIAKFLKRPLGASEPETALRRENVFFLIELETDVVGLLEGLRGLGVLRELDMAEADLVVALG